MIKTQLIKMLPLGVLVGLLSPAIVWAQLPAQTNNQTARFRLTPEYLRGEWEGQDGKTYRIDSQGAIVSIQVPVKHSTTISTYTGSFHPSQIDLSAPAKTIEEIDPTLDKIVRKNLVNRPYTFKARLELTPEGRLQLIKLIDNVTYSAKTFAIKNIDENAGEEVIPLFKGGGYILGKTTLDDTGYRRRLEAMLAALDQQIKITQETQLTAAKADFEHHTQIWNEERTRIQELEKQYQANSAILQQAKKQLASLQASQNWKKKLELERNIQTIQDAILSGKEQARINDALKRLQDYTAELEKTHQTLEKEAHSLPQYNALESKIKAAIQDNIRLQELISHLYDQVEPFRLKALEALEQKEKLESEIQQKERKKEFLENSKPHLTGLLLTAGGKEHYVSTEEIDPNVLKQLDTEFTQYQMAWNQSKKTMDILREQLQQNKALKNELADEFNTAKKNFLEVSQELNDVLKSGAYKHAALDTAIEGGEVLYKTLRKGPLAGFMVAAFKTMENALTTDPVAKDDTFRLPVVGAHVRAPFGYMYKMYDESELKKQFYQRAYLEEMAETGELPDDAKNYFTEELMQQWQKSPSTLLGTAADTVKEGKELRTTITALIHELKKSPGKWQATCEVLKNTKGTTLEERAEALKELLEKEVLEEAAAVETPRAAFRAIKALKTKYMKYTFQDAFSAATGLAGDVALDMAKDIVQNYLHDQINADQQFKWEEFFEYDFRMMKAQQLYRRAITNYWNTQEALHAQESFQEGMLALMLHTRKLQESYLTGKDTCGLHIAKNSKFYAEEVPLTLRVTITAPPDRPDVQEATVLFPNAPNDKPIKRLPGQFIGTPMPPPTVMQPLSPNSPAPQGTPTAYERYHFFNFPAEQLKNMQKEGSLSLTVQQL